MPGQTPRPADDPALGVARAGRLIDRTLCLVRSAATPGTTVGRLDHLTRHELARSHAIPSMLGFRDAHSPHPFPAALSVCINETISGDSDPARILQPGDLVTADLALGFNGWHADAALTWVVPGAPASARRALSTAARSVTLAGVRAALPETPWVRVVHAMSDEARRLGVALFRGYDAHGVGVSMHVSPRLPTHPDDLHRLEPPGLCLKPGMSFTVEPVVGFRETEVVRHGWLDRTADGSDACFAEMTVLIGRRGNLVLAGDC